MEETLEELKGACGYLECQPLLKKYKGSSNHLLENTHMHASESGSTHTHTHTPTYTHTQLSHFCFMALSIPFIIRVAISYNPSFLASHQTLINGELLHPLSSTPQQAGLQLPSLYSPPDPIKQLKTHFV